MNTVSHQELSDVITKCESQLETVMRYCPSSFMPDGMRLCGSICGFATNVLGQYLQARGIKTERKIGTPADDPSQLPDGMGRHVVLHTQEGSTIDPTFGQFLNCIGLNEALGKGEDEAYSLYPNRRIAYIPAGQEHYFGERFADFALMQREHLRTIRQKRLIVGSIACEVDYLQSGLDDEKLYKVLSGIWLPDRYRSYTPDGDLQVQANKAVDALLASD